jgi:uncharacterized protein (DUF1778 family)
MIGSKRIEGSKAESYELRLSAAEKQAFREAAAIAGLPMAGWVRERLRRAAWRELEEANRSIPFIPNAGL